MYIRPVPAKSEMRDCVLSGRFTKYEDAEFRRLAASMSMPVKSLVRTVMMEWKTRQESAFDSKGTEVYYLKPEEGNAHVEDHHQEGL